MPITYLFSRDSPINFPLGLKRADVDGSHVPGVLLKEKTQMTQIKEAFEGCCEALAPLKLNEVFIRHADSTLHAGTSRAVTVNVLPLKHAPCLFSSAAEAKLRFLLLFIFYLLTFVRSNAHVRIHTTVMHTYTLLIHTHTHRL